MKTTYFLLVFVSLAFFACSNIQEPDILTSSSSGTETSSSSSDALTSSSSGTEANPSSSDTLTSSSSGTEANPSSSDTLTSSSSGTEASPNTSISSQVYSLQKEQDNVINIPYTGNGVIKNIVRDLSEGMEEKPIDTVEVGTIVNGKINLSFYTPKKEHLSDDGHQMYYDLKLYDNANNPVGSLVLMNLEDPDDSFTGFYTYFSDDYKYENIWTHFQEYQLKFATDIDIKKGWNLIYENDKYDYDENGEIILFTLTKTNNPSILKNKKLKWYLLEPDAH